MGGNAVRYSVTGLAAASALVDVAPIPAVRHCRHDGIAKTDGRHVEAGLGSVKDPPAPTRVTLPRNISTTLRGLEDADLESMDLLRSEEVLGCRRSIVK